MNTLQPPSAEAFEADQALLQRIQRGDRTAIASLYDRYAPLVYSMALHLLQDTLQAENVVSNIFIEIWRDPQSLAPIAASLPLYMTVIARKKAVEMLRQPPLVDQLPAPGGRTESGLALSVERQPALRDEEFATPHRFELEKMPSEAALSSSLAETPSTPTLELRQSADPESAASRLAGTGLEVIDIESDRAFAQRKLRLHDPVAHIEGMNRLASAFAGDPAKILQQLAAAAVDLCGADSAGISVVESDSTDESFYHWVAAAGHYSGFLGAKLPRYPSACGVTLERDRPQLFRVTQRFFDLMGIQAPTVTDGLLFPWHSEQTCGTIWVMAHGRDEAFDREDCRVMQALANFASTGVRLQQLHEESMRQAKDDAETHTANRIARQIDSPLRGLIQTVYLFERGAMESEPFTRQAIEDLSKLSDLVDHGFSLPN